MYRINKYHGSGLALLHFVPNENNPLLYAPVKYDDPLITYFTHHIHRDMMGVDRFSIRSKDQVIAAPKRT